MSDPINPAHYNGTACAQIGERLTANSYQVLKYNWRLGRKDDLIIEMGKSIWYLDREIALFNSGPVVIPGTHLPNTLFFAELLNGVDSFVQMVAWDLVEWNRFGDGDVLIELRDKLIENRAALESKVTGQGTLNV